jgi:hypothetical protein
MEDTESAIDKGGAPGPASLIDTIWNAGCGSCARPEVTSATSATAVARSRLRICYKSNTLRVRLSRGFVAALIIAAVHTHVAGAEDTPQAFIGRLRSGLAAGNRRAVAAMFRYPLRATSALPLPIPIDNPAATLQMYDLLFTPEMRCAIELAQVPRPDRPAPKYPLLANGGALTLGGGVLIAERGAGAFRITRISMIGVPGGQKPGVPAQQQAADLRFRGSVQFAGLLSGDGFDRYTVRLTKGALLRGRLERFRGLDAVFRVTDAGGNAVDAKADGRRTWAATIPESATYRVDIVRKAAFCDPTITYLLTLTVK